jgi:hypothetical protein
MNRQMARRPRVRRLVHKMEAGDVIARIEAVEVALHLGQFGGAIARQRLRRLVGKTLRTLGLQPRGEKSGAAASSAARRATSMRKASASLARQASTKPAATPAAAVIGKRSRMIACARSLPTRAGSR